MFLEQAWCCGLRGDKKAKTIPGKLGEGEGQSGHSESILKFECKGQRRATHSPCSESFHSEVTGLNLRGHFASYGYGYWSREHVTSILSTRQFMIYFGRTI